MKHFVFAAILGAIACLPSVAEAQSYRDGSRGYSQDQRHDRGRDHRRSQHRGNQRGHQRNENRGHRRDWREDRRDHRRDRRWTQNRGHHRTIVHRAPPRYRAPPRHVTRVIHAPARPVYRDTRWRRGQYLPAHYRGDGYYIDHRHHRLAPPPRGHRYVRIDGDAVLIGVATGLITAVMAGAFH